MDNLSRRSFIKGFGSLGLSSCLQTPFIAHSLVRSRSDEIEKYLNVVLHGLFVLNFTQNDIELLTPAIEEHEYHAGSWDRDYIYPLHKGHKYKLHGISCLDRCVSNPRREGSADGHNNDCNVVLSQSRDLFTVNQQKTHFVVHLPFPADVYLTRCLRPEDPSTLFSGPDAYLIGVQGISLCPVLTYSVSSYKRVKLEGTEWKPKVRGYLRQNRNRRPEMYQAANLHFWAEPPERSNPRHTQMAYKKLMDLIPPLQFELSTDEMPPVEADPQVPGLLREEEQGWAEWQGGGGEGSRPTNCNPLMTTH